MSVPVRYMRLLGGYLSNRRASLVKLVWLLVAASVALVLLRGSFCDDDVCYNNVNRSLVFRSPTISRTILPSIPCSDEARNKQAKAFKEFRRIYWAKRWVVGRLGCGHLEGLDQFLVSMWNPSRQLVTLVNIGANKGYNLVEWIERWRLVRSKSPRGWGDHLYQTYEEQTGQNGSKLCGSCRDCEAEPHNFTEVLRDRGMRRGVHIFGLEPSITNYKVLLELKAWSGYGRMTLLNAAADNVSGIADFPITTLGFTKGHLGDEAGPTASVRIFTVEELMEEHRIEHINYLKIDTEGHDPHVLASSEQALKAHRIELLEFEYHEMGHWAKTRLQTTVEWLDSLGYDCFLELWQTNETRNTVMCLTGCWDDVFEFHGWANVVCSSRRSFKLTKYLRKACAWR